MIYVDQLLDVARAEVDPTALRPESIDLESLLTEVIDECSIEAREHACSLEVRAENAGSVSGDPELLRRAIENPLRNAIRHSPSGSCVEVIGDGDAEFAVISIQDRGPAFPIPPFRNYSSRSTGWSRTATGTLAAADWDWQSSSVWLLFIRLCRSGEYRARPKG